MIPIKSQDKIGVNDSSKLSKLIFNNLFMLFVLLYQKAYGLFYDPAAEAGVAEIEDDGLARSWAFDFFF